MTRKNYHFVSNATRTFMINFSKQIAFNWWQLTSFYRQKEKKWFPVNKFIRFLIEYKKSIIFSLRTWTQEKLTIRDKWHYEVSATPSQLVACNYNSSIIDINRKSLERKMKFHLDDNILERHSFIIRIFI